VEHLCHRCGASVSDNAPFCSQCGAPQIRVSIGQPDSPQGPAQGSAPPVVPVSLASRRVIWSAAFSRTIIAAVLGTVLLVLFQFLLPPFLVLILLVPFTGAIAVWLYRSRDPLVSAGKGFRVGMVAGFMLFLLNAVLGVVAFFLNRVEVVNTMKQQFEIAASRAADPNAQQMLRNLAERPDAMLTFVVFGAMLTMIIFVIFCGIGGAIAGRGTHHN
jgi:hypothetical protein